MPCCSGALYIIDLTYQSLCLYWHPNHYLPLMTTSRGKMDRYANDCKINSKLADTKQEMESYSKDVRLFLWSMTKMGIIIAYFYICDRTNFFMREKKWVFLEYVAKS